MFELTLCANRVLLRNSFPHDFKLFVIFQQIQSFCFIFRSVIYFYFTLFEKEREKEREEVEASGEEERKEREMTEKQRTQC